MKSHKIYYLQHSLIMFKEICDVGGIIFFIIIKLIAEFYLFDVFLNNVGRRNDEHSFNELAPSYSHLQTQPKFGMLDDKNLEHEYTKID